MQSLRGETVPLKKVFSFRHPLRSHRLPAGEGGTLPAFSNGDCNGLCCGTSLSRTSEESWDRTGTQSETEMCQWNKKCNEAGGPFLAPEAVRCEDEFTGKKVP